MPNKNKGPKEKERKGTGELLMGFSPAQRVGRSTRGKLRTDSEKNLWFWSCDGAYFFFPFRRMSLPKTFLLDSLTRTKRVERVLTLFIILPLQLLLFLFWKWDWLSEWLSSILFLLCSTSTICFSFFHKWYWLRLCSFFFHKRFIRRWKNY